MVRYRTIKEQAVVEQVIEKSRFIAHAKPVESKEEAEAFLAEIRGIHRGATHNVPAFVLGEQNEIQWASDDGEPSGTSGAPILQLLLKEQVTNLVVVVTRYFGGIKLGTGGLVRAYTGSAKQALAKAGICQVEEMDLLRVRVDYSYLGVIQNRSENGDFKIQDQLFEDLVTLRLATMPERTKTLLEQLKNITGGKLELIDIEKVLTKNL